MTTILSPARWARRSAAHPWRVVAAWAVALVVSFAIIATLLAGALTTQQGFVSNPESKQAATGIEQRQGTKERIVETVVIQPASPAAQAAVVAAVQKNSGVASAQVGAVSASSSLVQVVLKGDREEAGDEIEAIITAAQSAAEAQGSSAKFAGPASIDARVTVRACWARSYTGSSGPKHRVQVPTAVVGTSVSQIRQRSATAGTAHSPSELARHIRPGLAPRSR